MLLEQAFRILSLRKSSSRLLIILFEPTIMSWNEASEVDPQFLTTILPCCCSILSSLTLLESLDLVSKVFFDPIELSPVASYSLSSRSNVNAISLLVQQQHEDDPSSTWGKKCKMVVWTKIITYIYLHMHKYANILSPSKCNNLCYFLAKITYFVAKITYFQFVLLNMVEVANLSYSFKAVQVLLWPPINKNLKSAIVLY